jgi:outer membrane protein assembly factor BamA
MFDVAFTPRDHLWLGGGYKYARLTANLHDVEDLDVGDPSLVPSRTYDLGILNLNADWDTRSNEFYPTSGMLIHADINISATATGSDASYVAYVIAYNSYHAINDRNVLAWRVAGETVTGDPPFFARPWYGSGTDLRGYTPGVYVGQSLLAAQAEWRFQATTKLGLVAFAGTGGVYGKTPGFQQDDWLPAGGIGIRWRVADDYHLNFRVDYAWGKGDQTLLISVGEAF